MNTTEILAVSIVIGVVISFLIGYKSSKIIAQHLEDKWWEEMTYEDRISETPIYNKLMREYGNLHDMPRQ